MERLFHPPKIIFLISPKSMWAELGNGQVWRAREGFGKFPPPLVDPPLEPESPIDEREGRTDSISNLRPLGLPYVFDDLSRQ